MTELWAKFRALPWWAQAVGWVALWPALLTLLLWTQPRAALPAKLGVALVAVLVQGAWLTLPFGGSEPARVEVAAPAEEQSTEAARTREPSPEPSTPTTPSSPPASPSPSVSAPPAPAVPQSPTASSTPTQTVAAAPAMVPSSAQRGVVERVVDGDTIWVRATGAGSLATNATHKIRLLQVDTPETKHPQKGVECWGPEASDYTSRVLAPGTVVWLEADREDTDRFGRFLRYVWLEDGRLANEMIVEEGHGRAVLYEPNDRYIDRMRAAESAAKSAGDGMWGQPCDHDAPAPPPEDADDERDSDASNQSEDCSPNYEGACIPPYPPDVNCGDVTDRGFRSVGDDPHGFDGDGDGVACEG